MDLDDDGIGEYDAYSAPVSYGNSMNDHYGSYGENLPPVPPLPPNYQVENRADTSGNHYPPYSEQPLPGPPLPPLYPMNDASDAYTLSTTPMGHGATPGSTQVTREYPSSDVYHTPLGGSVAFEVDTPEMVAMTGSQHSQGEPIVNANLGRSRSGRFQ